MTEIQMEFSPKNPQIKNKKLAIRKVHQVFYFYENRVFFYPFSHISRAFSFISVRYTYIAIIKDGQADLFVPYCRCRSASTRRSSTSSSRPTKRSGPPARAAAGPGSGQEWCAVPLPLPSPRAASSHPIGRTWRPVMTPWTEVIERHDVIEFSLMLKSCFKLFPIKKPSTT